MSQPCRSCIEYKTAYEYEANMNTIYRSILLNLLANLNNEQKLNKNDHHDNGTVQPPERKNPRDSAIELEENTM